MIAEALSLMPSRHARTFAFRIAVVSSVAYLVAGALAYHLLTKRFYVGNAAIFAVFLRSETDSALWNHVMKWQLPILLVRSSLIALALMPLRTALMSFAAGRRVAVLFVLFFVLLHLAAAAPSPSNLEGIVYMRPELVSIDVFLLTQPEMVLQSLLLALGIGLWAARDRVSARTASAPPEGRCSGGAP